MPRLSLKSNPLWIVIKPSPVDLLTYSGELQPGTLWTTDAQGFKSPTNGRAITAEEDAQLKEFNSQRKELNESGRKAVDALMQRLIPLGDINYKELTYFKATAIESDISWLYDHPAGSDFYANELNADSTGDWALGRLQRYMKEAGLEFDLAEITEKVSGGISTPIVINLDGAGIITTSLGKGKTVFFDIDGDGKKEETAWISGNNAFLAVDKNGNGNIDGINELFGGKERGAGFAKLAEFDSNGDGKIDKNDEMYSELLLWHDKNHNGVTDDGELQSAEKAGLESISLDYISQDFWQNGNLLGEVSSAIYQGKKVDAVDVYFRFNSVANPIVFSEKIALPITTEIPGFADAYYPNGFTEPNRILPDFVDPPAIIGLVCPII